MHEITFASDDKPKLLSQVFDRFSHVSVIMIFIHSSLNRGLLFGCVFALLSSVSTHASVHYACVYLYAYIPKLMALDVL